MAMSEPGAVGSIDALRAEREAYIEHFRIYGEFQAQNSSRLEREAAALVQRSEGETKARALFELATIRRITNRFEEAIKTYTEAARAAQDAGLDEVGFDAWIGIARAHAYGTKDHGAAAEAFARAREIAGEDRSRKQAYDMADYAAQLQAGRGELEAALVSAIAANRLAETDTERFYAQLDAGDVLQKFAESCDYRKLVDANSSTDEEDGWGACRRAVSAAQRYYAAARETAQALGWEFLAGEAEGFISRLGPRLFLIDQRAAFEKLGTSSVFTAQDVADVVVNDNFAAGASELPEYAALGELIAEVVADSQTDDPRSLYLLGIKADLDGQGAAALDYFERAAAALEQERSTLFDLRRRGTVVENRPELVRDLGLRLLALDRPDEAFQAFESIRARGLGELAAIYQAHRFTDAERRWLAALTHAESQQSALLKSLVEVTIAGVEHSRSMEIVGQLEELESRHRKLLAEEAFGKTRRRLTGTVGSRATLEDLRAQVRETDIPVVLYWSTQTNVVVWVISPRGMAIKTVFLPEVAVIDKVGRIESSIRSKDEPYDETAARELYTYLIAPFADHLAGEQLLLVPQGPLVTLAFEALVDPRTGRFLAETKAVSYAPSATFALRALRQPPPRVSELTALVDGDIERVTGEVAKMRGLEGLEVTEVSSQGLSAADALASIGGHDTVHVLLHGTFDAWDPLQSRVSLNNPSLSREENAISAAELLAVDWRDTHLAVFSSCEGARLNVRISNEVYGLSWGPLVGGVDHVLMSRWRVQADSNADWMAAFYQRLAAGEQSPARAAASAMRAVIAGERGDPFYWAAPQVFGR